MVDKSLLVAIGLFSFWCLGINIALAKTVPEIIKAARVAVDKHAPNRDIVAVIDWTRPAAEHRFFLVSLKKNKIVYSWFTSHGKNTGTKHRAVQFSNVPESHKSSLGIMRVAETYIGKNGYSVRLDGLSPTINSNIRQRVIVMHPSDYVSASYMKHHHYPGQSLGCITLNPEDAPRIINLLKEGGIIVNLFA